MPPSFSKEDREEAFLVWLLEADRDGEETARILARLRPTDQTPTGQSIRNWAKAEDWDALAQEYFATHAPERYYRHLGRAMLHLDLVASWRTALFTPGHPDFDEMTQKELHTLRSVQAIAIETMTGAGMHGQKVPRQEIPIPTTAVDAGDAEKRLERRVAAIEAMTKEKKP